MVSWFCLIFKPWALLFGTFWGICFIFSRVLKQIQGLDWGFRLDYEGYDASAQQIWPAVPGFLQATWFLLSSGDFGLFLALHSLTK